MAGVATHQRRAPAAEFVEQSAQRRLDVPARRLPACAGLHVQHQPKAGHQESGQHAAGPHGPGRVAADLGTLLSPIQRLDAGVDVQHPWPLRPRAPSASGSDAPGPRCRPRRCDTAPGAVHPRWRPWPSPVPGPPQRRRAVLWCARSAGTRPPVRASACPASRACRAHCRCGRPTGKSTPSARTRRRQPGTPRTTAVGRAAWPTPPRPRARACARPTCPPPAAPRAARHRPGAAPARCVLLHPVGGCANTARCRASPGSTGHQRR